MYVRISTQLAETGSIPEHSLASAVEKAEIAEALGIPLNPELLCCTVYGDLGAQPYPDFSEYPALSSLDPWWTLSLAEMEDALEIYGAIVADAILDTGVMVNVWDIGNECIFGFAGVAPQPFPGALEEELGLNWYHAPDTIDPDIGLESVYDLIFNMTEQQAISWLSANVWPYEAH